MIVYLVTNKINGKMYVGQTSDLLSKRWADHGLPSNKRNLYFGNSIRKYGRDSFSVETLHVCATKDEMDFCETFYISLLNTKSPNGYNLTDGGEGTPGHTVSDEGRLRMHLSHLGKKQTEQTKRRKSEALRKAHKERRWGFSAKGFVPWNKDRKDTFKHTDAARAAISEAMRGNTHSKGKPWSPARRAAQLKRQSTKAV
jgi:group I intron endonuclease